MIFGNWLWPSRRRLRPCPATRGVPPRSRRWGPLEVEDRDQHFESFRPVRVREPSEGIQVYVAPEVN
jgi:hypothetical protein